MQRKLHLLILFVFAACSTLSGQHTFSIVAVDTVTGEVGSAGASCVTGFGVKIIADVHPGVGAINTQAWLQIANKNYARDLMNSGHTPQQIIDSLRTNDKGSDGRDSTYRQYGVADLFGTGARAAGHTGSNADDWKGHIVGPNYSIQGNILLGPQILDSMEARFLNTPGELAVKLMAALQGANVPGADTRCLAAGTSSTSSYIQVARPGDVAGGFYLDIGVNPLASGKEPIDSLQTLFDAWLLSTASLEPEGEGAWLVFPNPASEWVFVQPRQDHEGHQIQLVLRNLLGQEVLRQEAELAQQLRADVGHLSQGLYLYEVRENGIQVQQGKLMLK
jgi:uncharacterized Ntn-hydrolase superfamily protein